MSSYTLFTLGNDAVLEWLIPFFNSLRSLNNKVEVRVIPFDSELTQLKKLESVFDFEIIEHKALNELENIGAAFWDGNVISGKTWRKLACFTQNEDPFIFLDSDIVFNEDPDILYEVYEKSQSEFMCFDIDETQVYKKGSFRDEMKRKYNAVSFNSGGFISKGGLFNLEQIKEKASEIYEKKAFFLGWGDQTFINYLVDTSLEEVKIFAEESDEHSSSTWAKNKIAYRAEKAIIQGKIMPFIHWAGFDINQFMPSRDIYLKWRLYGSFSEDRERVYQALYRGIFGKKILKVIGNKLIPQFLKNKLRDLLYRS